MNETDEEYRNEDENKIIRIETPLKFTDPIQRFRFMDEISNELDKETIRDYKNDMSKKSLLVGMIGVPIFFNLHPKSAIKYYYPIFSFTRKQFGFFSRFIAFFIIGEKIRNKLANKVIYYNMLNCNTPRGILMREMISPKEKQKLGIRMKEDENVQLELIELYEKKFNKIKK
jgi:hypothetical protein